MICQPSQLVPQMIQHQCAPWPKRMLAALLDLVFHGAWLCLVVLLFNKTPIMLPALALADMAYGVLVVKWFHGSPAKRMVVLKLFTLKGAPISYLAAMARHYPMVVAVLLLGLLWISSRQAHPLDKAMALLGDTALTLLVTLWLFNHGAAFINPDRRALHDYLAGTVVRPA